MKEQTRKFPDEKDMWRTGIIFLGRKIVGSYLLLLVCITICLIVYSLIPVDYEPEDLIQGDSLAFSGIVRIEQVIEIEFNDRNGYVEYIVPERCEKKFLERMRKVSRHYNVADVVPLVYTGGSCVGIKTMQWHDEVCVWKTGVDLEDGEYMSISAPENGKKYLRHFFYKFFYPLRGTIEDTTRERITIEASEGSEIDLTPYLDNFDDHKGDTIKLTIPKSHDGRI